jgi:hypothetical protein
MKAALNVLLAAATAVVLAGCGNAAKTTASEPNLQETEAWMHDFVADRGTGATFEGSGCSGSITWLDKGSPYYTFRFSFGDLDPNTAKSGQTVMSPPPALQMWRATAVTTNNLRKVDVYNHQTNQRTQDSVIEGIPFSSVDDANRFAKALRRAIVLCGGKPSAF